MATLARAIRRAETDPNDGFALVAVDIARFRTISSTSRHRITTASKRSFFARLRYGPRVEHGPSLTALEKSELRLQVTAAIEHHMLWREQLQTAIDTGQSDLVPETVAREDVCPVGVWLNTTISEQSKRTPL